MEYALFNQYGDVMTRHTVIYTTKGEPYYLIGGTPPKHAGSTGKVWVSTRADGKGVVEFFPSVFGLHWAPSC